MTSLGKRAYTCMHRNSHTVYEINMNYFRGGGVQEHYRGSQELFSVVTFSTLWSRRGFKGLEIPLWM